MQIGQLVWRQWSLGLNGKLTDNPKICTLLQDLTTKILKPKNPLRHENKQLNFRKWAITLCLSIYSHRWRVFDRRLSEWDFHCALLQTAHCAWQKCHFLTSLPPLAPIICPFHSPLFSQNQCVPLQHANRYKTLWEKGTKGHGLQENIFAVTHPEGTSTHTFMCKLWGRFVLIREASPHNVSNTHSPHSHPENNSELSWTLCVRLLFLSLQFRC